MRKLIASAADAGLLQTFICLCVFGAFEYYLGWPMDNAVLPLVLLLSFRRT